VHFAYGPADVTASQNLIISCLIQIQTGLPFWYQVVLEKRPLNGCGSNVVRGSVHLIRCGLQRLVEVLITLFILETCQILYPPVSLHLTYLSDFW